MKEWPESDGAESKSSVLELQLHGFELPSLSLKLHMRTTGTVSVATS